MLLTVASEGGAVFRNQPYEAAMLTNQPQRDSRLPLIFAADFERGRGACAWPRPSGPQLDP